MTTTPTTDDSEDPRIALVASALESEAAHWVIQEGEDITIALEVAAAIAIDALSDVGICNEQCHADEYNSITEAIREMSDMAGREEILAMIEVGNHEARP